MKTFYSLLLIGLLPLTGFAQVNSGSDGHDGALNPASNLVIDMADHPDGIYHYTSVNIPAGVTVSFIPNAGNKPVVWLVQGDCIINGLLNVSAPNAFGEQSGPNATVGGPGGWLGGTGGSLPTAGQGPGGGGASSGNNGYGGDGGFGTIGTSRGGGAGGQTYGNVYLIPLLGGSGGGGSHFRAGANGGGGGGAILIAASGTINASGQIFSYGAQSTSIPGTGNIGGSGSGGAIRLVATRISGTGSVVAQGGGRGRIRFDTNDNSFAGVTDGVLSQGFQPIILPAPGQGIQLAIQSVGGVAVAANPSGVLSNPDVIVPAQQTNPVSIVVSCTNVSLNSEIAVVVRPANGAEVQAVGLNNAGTAASSTATVSLNMPRGGGIIYAKAVTGIGGNASVPSPGDSKTRSLAETGWTADGERFAKIEVTAALGGAQRIAYITESGKRYEAQ